MTGNGGAPPKATIVTRAQFFFAVGLTSIRHGVLLGRTGRSREQSDNEDINE
jgi:hypothetical protein